MAEDIRREYPYIFDVVRQTVQYLEQQLGVQISDNEVAYLALHFGGHLECAKREDKELRILVVCMNGVATGNMLIHELGRILPEAKLAGVRLVVGEIVPAFKGIAKKAVPHAKPAVDCPILFTYAPNAVMLGFLVSFAGGIFTMLALMAVNAWYGALVVPVIVPGVAAHFFCGGTAGVFANAEGGLKSCIAGSFVHGILISLLALFVMPVLGTLNLSGTTFSDTDFCAAGILFGELARWIPENAVFAICVCCFAIPIVWQRCKKRIE